MRPLLGLAPVLALALALPAPLAAADREVVTARQAARPSILPGSTELDLWGGYRWFLEEGENLDDTLTGGFRAAVHPTRVLGIEASLGYAQTTTLERSKVTHVLVGVGNLVFHLAPRRRVVPYLAVGAGVRWYSVPSRPAGEGTLFDSEGRPLPAFKNPDADAVVDAAFGVKVLLTRRVLARVEARYDMVIGGPSEGGTDADGQEMADRWDNLQATLAVGVLIGGLRPAVDSDLDGIIDAEDYCPNEAEDKDGFEDGDGCADADNDQDGFADAVDRCRDEAEAVNGFEDDDGCPDEVPAVAVALPPPPAPEPEPEPEPVPEAAPIEVIERFSGTIEGVWFASDSTAFTASSFPVLNSAAEVLRRYPTLKVEVQGHASADGDDAHNLDLSQRRAEAVMRYLVNLGVAPERLSAVGHGERFPVADNDSREGRSRNRRVEFRVLSP